jgi:hypothetical protein
VDNDEQLGDAGLCHDRRSRQGISSNTWTSSSGEGSEDDGNDDRTPFVDEYNRLAKKVCLNQSEAGRTNNGPESMVFK